MIEQPESNTEKRERLKRKLEEAAREYKEDRNKGWARIGYLVKNIRKGEVEMWHSGPAQIAEVTETRVVFAQGDTFQIEFVEDVILLGKIDE